MLSPADTLKQVGDTTAITAAMAAFFELLPTVISNVSAVCALIYLLLRIYEMFKGEGSVAKWLRKK